jgi:hypothetical protein
LTGDTPVWAILNGILRVVERCAFKITRLSAGRRSGGVEVYARPWAARLYVPLVWASWPGVVRHAWCVTTGRTGDSPARLPTGQVLRCFGR